jgi:hypothetical protein
VAVSSTCSTGADVDTAGLAQAEISMIIANNRDVVRFIVPLFVGKTKRSGTLRSPLLHSYDYMSLR